MENGPNAKRPRTKRSRRPRAVIKAPVPSPALDEQDGAAPAPLSGSKVVDDYMRNPTVENARALLKAFGIPEPLASLVNEEPDLQNAAG